MHSCVLIFYGFYWQENVLDHLHKFLDADEDNEHETSLEERTKSAIVLLQCLPCARSAVLEQIGEVFHEVAKQYVIEVEKQMLSGKYVIFLKHTFLHSEYGKYGTFRRDLVCARKKF